jgi:hypothetical protein
MSMIIGVIAEDISDIDVVDELIKKILPLKKFSIRYFIGHGCGKIRGKCYQWARVLKAKGCSTLIVLHDLDQNDLPDLNTQLSQALANCSISKNVIVIPIREIEAWLISDSLAIHTAMKLQENFPVTPNPEELIDPKKKLGDLIYLRSGKTKRYLNTAHNKKIAAELDLAKVRRCPSFLPLEKFVLDNIK